MTQHTDVDEGSVAMRIEYLAGDPADPVADGEDHLGRGVVEQLGLVDLQPQALQALAVGKDLGFREVGHGKEQYRPAVRRDASRSDG